MIETSCPADVTCETQPGDGPSVFGSTNAQEHPCVREPDKEVTGDSHCADTSSAGETAQ